MKILFLVHSFPFPPDDGMRSTSYRVIKHLAAHHEVSLLSMVESEAEKAGMAEMRRHCRRVEVVAHAPPRSGLARAANILFDPVPFCVRQFESAAFAAKLKAMLAEEEYDIVHLLSVNVSSYQNCLSAAAGLYFPHDSVSMQFYRNIERESNLLRKLYMWSQWRKMERYERRILPGFSRTVMVTDVDREWTEKILPGARVLVIPAGVDPEEFKPLEIEEPAPSVVFRGVMNFPPNVDAALYFHHEIAPLVRKEIPDLRFVIVGKLPEAAVQRLHDGVRTIVTGRVDDIRPWMAKATVNICPMRTGSGIKNKILEALSMARAVAATRLACDGIAVEDGRHLLAADSAPDFAAAVVRLVRDASLRKELGRQGRELILKHYSWASVALRYNELYKQIKS